LKSLSRNFKYLGTSGIIMGAYQKFWGTGKNPAPQAENT